MPSKKSHRRGEAVVSAVLDATLHVLARDGFNGLRYEVIAEMAGVNKSTIYRRWPSKSELVRDVIHSIPGSEKTPPATGSVSGDLIVLGKRISKFFSSAEGEAIMQVLVTETRDEELEQLCEEMGRKRDRVVAEILHDNGVNERVVDYLAPLLPAAIFFRQKVMRKEISDAFLAELVKILLAGSQALSEEID